MSKPSVNYKTFADPAELAFHISELLGTRTCDPDQYPDNMNEFNLTEWNLIVEALNEKAAAAKSEDRAEPDR